MYKEIAKQYAALMKEIALYAESSAYRQSLASLAFSLWQEIEDLERELVNS